MKCGHCKRNDAGVTVEHVKFCDGRQTVDVPTQTELPVDFNDQWAAMKARGAEREREQERAAYQSKSDTRHDTLFSDLNAARKRVPAGRYALKGTDGVWKFYKVNKKMYWNDKAGREIEYTFLNVLASDTEHKLKSRQTELSILLRIGNDPQAAAKDYGHQIGQCFRCHAPLTKPESIERGMGKDCANAMGW
jgi:hypothetical protein